MIDQDHFQNWIVCCDMTSTVSTFASSNPKTNPPPPPPSKKKLTIHNTLDHFKQAISMSDLHIWLSSSDTLKPARKSLPSQKKKKM